MSMTTHRFQNYETLVRAQEWLVRAGIDADQIEINSTGLPSLTIRADTATLAEVEMILNAAELTDPEGWPPFDAIGSFTPPPIEARPDATEPHQVHTAPIGWHPID